MHIHDQIDLASIKDTLEFSELLFTKIIFKVINIYYLIIIDYISRQISGDFKSPFKTVFRFGYFLFGFGVWITNRD